jgi:RNA 2',3'-cyclic 3'-phosphodiesterase
MDLRCFIAVEIPDMIKKTIGDVINALRKAGADVKWVSHENIHITLKFLGSTDESLIGAIRASLIQKMASYSSFVCRISGTGYFPAGRYPKVIWIGVEQPGDMFGLQKDVEKEMIEFGFPEEDRPFSPHLTIGRVRSEKRTEELLKIIDEFRTVGFGELEIKGITLMKSELKPVGAQYYSLAEIPFGG